LKFSLLFAFLFLLVVPGILRTQSTLLDNFENISAWKPIASDGAAMKLERVKGFKGNALALRFDFHGSAYAIVQKHVGLDLPSNYKFTFYLRGDLPVNNFEFKLLDTSGNVFWIKKLDFDYPRTWARQIIRKRQITFAWGPAGGGEIKHVDRMEFVVSAGSGGGKGSIYIDELYLDTLPDSTGTGQPMVTASSEQKGFAPENAIKGDLSIGWRSAGTGGHQWWMMNFGKERELGGIVIDWEKDAFATAYAVELSDDGKDWIPAYRVVRGNGGRDYIPLPDAEAKLVRLNLTKNGNGHFYGIRNVVIKNSEFSSSPNNFFTAIAKEAPPGYFPKYFSGRMSYWTIIGADGDNKEALINEEGMVETDKLGFSLEPFLFTGGKLATWNDCQTKQSLDEDDLPVPSVCRTYGNLALTTTAFAAGKAGKSLLIVTYKLENKSSTGKQGSLYVAMRPFQVDPPWQALNMVGGVSKIRSISYRNGIAEVNSDKQVLSLSSPDGFGVAEFDQGDITTYLANNTLPAAQKVTDHFDHASGAFRYNYNLQPNGSKEFTIIVPFHGNQQNLHSILSEEKAHDVKEGYLHQTRAYWKEKLSHVEITLPKSARRLVNILKSSIAYILINRDGPAIQPGSRSYERAWIRDGALTSGALLRMGLAPEVREYIDWYSKYQYPDGKIPCVVDSRGADPTPENDSHGEYIYAVMQYFMFTHDTLWFRDKADNVVKAVQYIQHLRSMRMTDTYRSGTPEQRACYGLVTESISHEGYSAKPMHSYWDDLWTLRGLKDAAAMMRVLSLSDRAREFSFIAEDFDSCLYRSMRLAMQNKNIDYIPGCVELGDFDATSTAIGVNPIGELGSLPEPQLTNTFDRYYKFFADRRDGKLDWDNYTPYEVRIIGALVMMDQNDRAHELLQYFMNDQRPKEWNNWAEVVWRDPSTPKMIGDMPHTWVASDYIRSVRSMFVYERERDTSLVIGAGVISDWLSDSTGMRVANLPTYYGAINFSMKRISEHDVSVDVAGSVNLPAGKIIFCAPMDRRLESISVDGISIKNHSREIPLPKFPVKMLLKFSNF
jgi:hypothetical protein